MPSGKAHAVVAAAATAALAYQARIPVDYVLIGVMGGLWPDVDTRKSMMGKFIPLYLVCRHRHFTHSFVGFMAFSGLSYLLTSDSWTFLCFGLGYLSHLFLDWMTPMGICWRWPKGKMYSLRR